MIEAYLKAIGGKDEVKKVNSIKTNFTMEMMGRSFEGTVMRMNPNKNYMDVRMGTNKLMERNFDGKTGYNMQMGKKQEFTADEIKESMDDKGVIPQAYYLTPDYKILYVGTGKAGNEESYKLKVTKPSGKVSVEYYSTKTGLLLKEEGSVTAGDTEVAQVTEYANYQKVNNIMVPFTVTQTVGEQEMQMIMKDAKINEDVTDNDFKK